METVTITIKRKNWKTLKQLELKRDFKTHDEAIEFLLKNLKSSQNPNKVEEAS